METTETMATRLQTAKTNFGELKVCADAGISQGTLRGILSTGRAPVQLRVINNINEYLESKGI